MVTSPRGMSIRRAYHRRMRALRFAVCVYGWLAYALFVRVMLHFVGFTADVMVRKTVEARPVGPWPLAVVVDTALVSAFAVPHSVMARPWFKDAVFGRLPAPLERSTYVLVSSATIALMIAAWRPIPFALWDLMDTPWGVVLRTISFAGWALSLAASLSLGHRTLFGLAPAWAYFRGRKSSAPSLRTTWLYGRLRHPMDLGVLIGVGVAPRMSVGHLLLFALFCAYVAIGVRYEERDLVAVHGAAYTAYRNRVRWL